MGKLRGLRLDVFIKRLSEYRFDIFIYLKIFVLYNDFLLFLYVKFCNICEFFYD